MPFRKIDPQGLLVWRIRLCLWFLLPSFLTALLFEPRSLWWLIATGAWVLAFLALFLWYFPLKYKKLSYAANEEILILNSGVIYTRRKSILARNIQYISITTLPLQKPFGLCTVVLHAAGGTLYLPCIRLGDALLLQDILTPSGKEAD